MTYDFLIVGAGIVGLSTAYKLSIAYPDAKILVLEKEDRVAAHQTGRNSGVIHSGIYYKPGSYKAKNCIEGRHELVSFCHEHNIAHEICGKIIVATDESEKSALDKIYTRGLENEIEGISMIGVDEMKEIEPWVKGVEAIHVPCSGIVDFTGVCRKLAELLEDAGNEIRLNSAARNVYHNNGTVTVQTDKEKISARYLINCAGLQSDRIARASGISSEIKIIPFRGEYYELTPEAQHKVKALIYPVPNPEFPFLGVHFTRMVLGGVECGPNAVFAFKREGYEKTSFDINDVIDTFNFPGFWKLAGRHWRMGVDEIYRSFSKEGFLQNLQKLIPSIGMNDIIESPSGVRAMALKPDGEILDDFFFETTENEVHVLNAPSPAATAGLAIGDEITAKVKSSFGL